MAQQFSEQREALVAAIHRMFEAGVMSHAGHANASVRLDSERMLLTASGSVRNLTTDQLAVVDHDGKPLDGQLEPAVVEIVPMHAAVYRHRPNVGSVIHTHSPAATAFALAHRPLPCRYEALLRFGQATAAPVVPWAPRGSQQSVRGITDALAADADTRVVLLANHGLLAFAEDPMHTAALIIALEEAAEAEIAAQPLDGARDFPPGALADVRREMARAPA